MPTGVRINWPQYDDLIREFLPSMTIVDFRLKYLPHISEVRLGCRARKLGIKPGDRKIVSDCYRRMAKALTKDPSPEIVAKLKELRQTTSISKFSNMFGVDKSTISKWLKRLKIELTSEGQKRGRSESGLGGIGRSPWNKGRHLSEETKQKIGLALTGEKNGQYGRPLTEEQKKRWSDSYRLNGVHSFKLWLRSKAGQIARQKTTLKVKSLKARSANSERTSKMLQSGKIKLENGISLYHQTIKGGSFTTKSLYEARFVELLELNGSVESFQYEPLHIEYYYEGCLLCYLPDFLVHYHDRPSELIEVKPSKLLNLPKNLAKFNACLNNPSYVFKVVSENDLGWQTQNDYLKYRALKKSQLAAGSIIGSNPKNKGKSRP